MEACGILNTPVSIHSDNAGEAFVPLDSGETGIIARPVVMSVNCSPQYSCRPSPDYQQQLTQQKQHLTAT